VYNDGFLCRAGNNENVIRWATSASFGVSDYLQFLKTCDAARYSENGPLSL